MTIQRRPGKPEEVAKIFKVELYRDVAEFEKHLNELAAEGHALHSWQVEKAPYRIVAIFKLRNIGG